jgi:hypothetical protein
VIGPLQLAPDRVAASNATIERSADGAKRQDPLGRAAIDRILLCSGS